jgi:hypothetical protein
MKVILTEDSCDGTELEIPDHDRRPDIIQHLGNYYSFYRTSNFCGGTAYFYYRSLLFCTSPEVWSTAKTPKKMGFFSRLCCHITRWFSKK